MEADDEKREAVVAAFKHAWGAYARDAMGYDEYHPIKGRGSNFSAKGGIGYTVVDAIDTMSEYEVARHWIETELSFNHSGSMVSTFETTIRVLGGLLSARYLTSDALFLKHAEDLGHRLVVAFNTSPAEAGSLQLEFKYLAELTQNETFWHKAEHVIAVMRKGLLPSGLAPTSMNVMFGTFQSSLVRLGSSADSYYEYLAQYLQTNMTEPIYQTMYDHAMDGIAENLMQQTPEENLTYMGELNPLGRPLANDGTMSTWNFGNRQEHLVCFLAGSLMLGARLRDWKMGIDFLEGCLSTHDTLTGLAPEVAQFRAAEDVDYPYSRDWFIPGRMRNTKNDKWAPYEAQYMLRPEIVESLFIAWRLTGDLRYRDWAWNIFSSIEKHARIPTGGYATVSDVDQIPVKLVDKQETFFLSETLKYLYLTFCESNVLPLQDIVFNTEAHPFPLFNPTIKAEFV
ncbi:glycoside hydrolase [Gymnopus androsaceus JB14]|uniref:alpha-1,2-Mannosidase n=1 Tax=Gymnopus androsaceus JB14 TaxID=1447944 RepID=A0A6A4GTN8_9AGAR|nr:glycoside hydrolase [Gymnopus androsaceus JB14]